jgi:hypothetical protein
VLGRIIILILLHLVLALLGDVFNTWLFIIFAIFTDGRATSGLCLVSMPLYFLIAVRVFLFRKEVILFLWLQVLRGVVLVVIIIFVLRDVNLILLVHIR